MKSRLFPSLLIAGGFSLLLLSVARAEDNNVSTIKFSDPAKPGTLKIIVGHGDLRVKGADVAECSIKSDSKPDNKPRKDGLRVITSSTSYYLAEKDNVITLSYGDRNMGGGSDFDLTVPRNTNVVINSAMGGSDVTCSDLKGDIEVRGVSGDIRLNNVAGGALVSTMNGEVHANIAELHDGKTLSFVAYNGEVDIRVPNDAKANVRLRSQNGEILTDFDEKALVTKTEAAPRLASTGRKGRTVTVLPADAQAAIHEAARVSTQAVREVVESIKDGAAEAKLDAARDQLEAAREKSDKAEVKRLEARLAEMQASTAAVAPMAPMAPIPPLPPMTGGKIVAGTLNGGGPEIQATTMNGDVKLLSPNWKK